MTKEIFKQQATPVFDGLLCEDPKDLIKQGGDHE